MQKCHFKQDNSASTKFKYMDVYLYSLPQTPMLYTVDGNLEFWWGDHNVLSEPSRMEAPTLQMLTELNYPISHSWRVLPKVTPPVQDHSASNRHWIGVLTKSSRLGPNGVTNLCYSRMPNRSHWGPDVTVLTLSFSLWHTTALILPHMLIKPHSSVNFLRTKLCLRVGSPDPQYPIYSLCKVRGSILIWLSWYF